MPNNLMLQCFPFRMPGLDLFDVSDWSRWKNTVKTLQDKMAKKKKAKQKPSVKTDHLPATIEDFNGNKHRYYVIALLLVTVTLLVFGQTTQYDFVGWDDDKNIYENPYITPEKTSDVLQFWKKPYEGLYIPLTYTMWAMTAKLSRFISSEEYQNSKNRSWIIRQIYSNAL